MGLGGISGPRRGVGPIGRWGTSVGFISTRSRPNPCPGELKQAKKLSILGYPRSKQHVVFCRRGPSRVGATGIGPSLLGARDPGGCLGFLGFPWFSLVFLGFSNRCLLVFLGFQYLWFSSSGSLDSRLTVLPKRFLGRG